MNRKNLILKNTFVSSKTFLLVLVMIFLLLMTLLSCQGNLKTNGSESAEHEKAIIIATLNGPTGMGMVALMGKDNYDITSYQAPDEITGKIITGEVDIACLPSNLAAVLYNKTQGNIKVLTVNTLGVLYILEKGEDIQVNTIYASGKGGVPEYVLEKVLKEKAANIEWMANHSDVASTFMTKENAISMLPEPFVTLVMSKDPGAKILLDLNEEWESITGQDLPMGVIVVQKTFIQERENDLKKFLEDYEKSVNFVNKDTAEAAKAIAEWGFIQDPIIAEKSIKGSNIVFYEDREESKSLLENFYRVLFEMNPLSIGGEMPNEDFYY